MNFHKVKWLPNFSSVSRPVLMGLLIHTDFSCTPSYLGHRFHCGHPSNYGHLQLWHYVWSNASRPNVCSLQNLAVCQQLLMKSSFTRGEAEEIALSAEVVEENEKAIQGVEKVEALHHWGLGLSPFASHPWLEPRPGSKVCCIRSSASTLGHLSGCLW